MIILLANVLLYLYSRYERVIYVSLIQYAKRTDNICFGAFLILDFKRTLKAVSLSRFTFPQLPIFIIYFPSP